MSNPILQELTPHINRLYDVQFADGLSPISLHPELNIPGLIIKDQIFVKINDQFVTCYFAQNINYKPDYCPNCPETPDNPDPLKRPSNKLHLKENKVVILRHIPNPYPCFVCYLVGRFVCPKCGAICSSRSDVRFGNTSLTKGLQNHVINLFLKDPSLTDKSIAEVVGLHQYQVTLIIDKYVISQQCSKYRLEIIDYALSNSEKILAAGTEVDLEFFCPFKVPQVINNVLIDEVSMRGRRYITHFVNNETGELLFYAKGNGKAAIQQFCHWGRNHFAKELHIACDMNANYATAFLEQGHNVVITHDKFHVFKNTSEHISNALDIVAKKNPHLELEKKMTKEIIFDFFTKKSDLKEERKDKLHEVLSVSKELLGLYNGTQAIYDSFDQSKTPEELSVRLKDAIKQFVVINSQGSFFEYEESMEILFHYYYRMYQAYNYQNLSAEEKADYINNRECYECAFQKSRKNSPLTRLMLLLHRHLDTLTNFAYTGLTSSPIEGFNNGFKECKHSKFGIKKILRFKFRLKIRSLVKYQPNVDVVTLASLKTTLC